MSPSPSIDAELPSPSARDAADSDELAAHIRAACASAGGVIGFDRYMELVLYTPRLGYYSAARNRFGEQGDFVTAPEISPLFARCVARQVEQVLSLIGGGAVLEVGAGSGVLAEGVLSALGESGHADAPYFILERSAGGRGFQRERLARFGERVQWLDDFPQSEAGGDFRGVIIANELLDAIPARCFQIDNGGVREMGVAPHGDGFVWASLSAARAGDGSHPQAPQQWPDWLSTLAPQLANGYRGEYAPARAGWINSAADALGVGALLLLDYGYPRHELYHPQRVNGTLACHYRHRVHGDPFLWPGLQDIGTHVDFTAIAQAGVDRALELAGYTTQAHFLLDCGLLDLLEQAASSGAHDERARIELTAQVQRLTLPAELGEAIKVIAFSRGLSEPLLGFRSRDLSHRL